MNNNEPDFRFPLRVYWQDTDAGGVVFHANYLNFFERARVEWLRGLGLSQEDLRTRLNVMLVISQLSVRYLQPARLDDLLEVDVTLEAHRAASVHLTQQVWRLSAPEPAEPPQRQQLGHADFRLACVDARTFQPCRIPSELHQCLNP